GLLGGLLRGVVHDRRLRAQHLLELAERFGLERLQVVRHELLPDLRGEAAAVDRAAGGVPDRLTTAGADPRGRRDLRRVADHPGLRVLARLRITLVVLVRTGLARALVRRR